MDDLYTTMHAAADDVERKMQRIFTHAALDGFDCDAILQAGQDWLDEDDADVERLRKAIEEFTSR